MRKRAMIVATVALAAVALRAPNAAACSCIADDRGHFDRAHSVFVGTVSLRDRPGPPQEPTVVTFAVSGVYKGDVPPTYRVQTASSGAECGIDFVPGERYTVFTSASTNNVLSTGSCDGTIKGSGSLEKSGHRVVKTYAGSSSAAPTSARRSGDDGARTGAIAAALVLIAAAGSLLVMRRIRRGRPAE